MYLSTILGNRFFRKNNAGLQCQLDRVIEAQKKGSSVQLSSVIASNRDLTMMQMVKPVDFFYELHKRSI